MAMERGAAKADRAARAGINMLKGKFTDAAVAKAFKLRYTPLEEVLPKR